MIKTAGTQAVFILGEERPTVKVKCIVLKNVIEKTVARDLLLFEKQEGPS